MKIEQKAKSAARFWNIVSVDGEDAATLTLYGDVVSKRPTDWWTGEPDASMYICPEDFAADLETIKDKREITVKINSVGGDVYTALAIHNALKALSGHKTVIVEGVAASAASVIAMAGDSIRMYAGSLMMIHNVSAFLMDFFTIAELKKVIRGCDASERAITAIYSAKTGLSEDSIRAMLDKETWMTGREAVEKGFADELAEGDGPGIAYNAEQHIMLVNGVQHKTDGLHIPVLPGIKPLELAASAAASVEKKPEKGDKGMEIKTVDELRNAYPELVAQVEAEAVAADRNRIQEIEEIQDTIGDAELIAAAKFTKPTNAAALALEAMKRAKAAGKAFMDARAEEMKPAAQVKATAAAPEDPEDLKAMQKAQEEAEIKATAELFKHTFCK